jgi:hypothetical protein
LIIRTEGITALYIGSPKNKSQPRSQLYFSFLSFSFKTYVIKQLQIIWNIKAIQARELDKRLPIRVQSAKRPVNKEPTAKKSPMRMNGNMNRVIKKK